MHLPTAAEQPQPVRHTLKPLPPVPTFNMTFDWTLVVLTGKYQVSDHPCADACCTLGPIDIEFHALELRYFSQIGVVSLVTNTFAYWEDGVRSKFLAAQLAQPHLARKSLRDDGRCSGMVGG